MSWQVEAGRAAGQQAVAGQTRRCLQGVRVCQLRLVQQVRGAGAGALGFSDWLAHKPGHGMVVVGFACHRAEQPPALPGTPKRRGIEEEGCW